MTENTFPKLQWRLREQMCRARIASVAELHRRLGPDRVLVSEVQLGRLVHALPIRLNTRLLETLCHTLDCAPGDLLHWEACDAVAPASPARRKRTSNTPSPDEIRQMVGPSFHLHRQGSHNE